MLKFVSPLSHLANMPKVNAACVIIGDEVLNGKIIDTNSRFFSRFCYDVGIKLGEIVTIGDDETQIVDTLRGLTKKYQFIVTSGGIGPTHDDITYSSIAKSFNLPTKLDLVCKERMQKLSNPESRLDAQALQDFYRMATFPHGPTVKNYYISDDLWVPICSIDQKVYILPGIPQLFTRMITEFTPTLKKIYDLKEQTHEYIRFFIKTALTESQISTYLRKLQEEADKISDEIKIGSYPHFGMGFNTISILGTRDHEKYLQDITKRTLKEVNGEQITAELEEQYSNANLS